MLKKLKKKLGLTKRSSAQAAGNETANAGEERPNIPEVAVREIKRMLFEAFGQRRAENGARPDARDGSRGSI